MNVDKIFFAWESEKEQWQGTKALKILYGEDLGMRKDMQWPRDDYTHNEYKKTTMKLQKN